MTERLLCPIGCPAFGGSARTLASGRVPREVARSAALLRWVTYHGGHSAWQCLRWEEGGLRCCSHRYWLSLRPHEARPSTPTGGLSSPPPSAVAGAAASPCAGGRTWVRRVGVVVEIMPVGSVSPRLGCAEGFGLERRPPRPLLVLRAASEGGGRGSVLDFGVGSRPSRRHTCVSWVGRESGVEGGLTWRAWLTCVTERAGGGLLRSSSL